MSALFWEYDSRIGRRLNLDPLPTIGVSPYAAFNNNPIWRQDELGDKDDLPLKIGKTSAKIQRMYIRDIVRQIENNKICQRTNLSRLYVLDLVMQEKVSLDLYDNDGNKCYGGVTTIGIGHRVHDGAIGSTQYDKQALEKEKPFLTGISAGDAFEMLANDLEDRVGDLNNFLKSYKITTVERNVFSALTDIYFNSGTKQLRQAITLYLANGKNGIIDGLKSHQIISARRDFQIRLINEDENSTIDPKYMSDGSSVESTLVDQGSGVHKWDSKVDEGIIGETETQQHVGVGGTGNEKQSTNNGEQ